MIVVDTNIISYFYLTSDNFSAQAEKLFSVSPQWSAPILWRSEFQNVLSLYLRKNFLSLHEAQKIMEGAKSFLKKREFEVSSYQVLELVNQSNCSSYDCEFVALAQDLDIPLITADKKILREFPKIALSMDAFLG